MDASDRTRYSDTLYNDPVVLERNLRRQFDELVREAASRGADEEDVIAMLRAIANDGNGWPG